MLRNTNYEARKTGEYRDVGTVNEINGVLGYKSSFPMKKDGISHNNLFSPNLMVRYAPGHMRNISNKDASLNYANLYSLNKTTEIEDGLSAIFGFDFKTNEKESDKEKLSLSFGQVFNYEENKDMPTKSSLDQHRSDIVGEINYNFSEIGNIDYSFLIDKDFNALNYQEVSTELNFGKVQFNLNFLEEQKHVGTERYASSGVTLNYNDQNKLSFSTKKNFKTESTEFYNLSYQYAIDCLTAGLVYRREFYQDSNLEPNDTLMLSITFIPFGAVNTPTKN
jgi:LPS-assembly protein